MQHTPLARIIALCNIGGMDNLVLRAKTKLKLNGEQLAAAIGVHPSTISRWETAGRVSGPAKRLIEEMLAARRSVTQ